MAMALGRIGDRRAVQPLLKVGAEDADAFLRHAIIYALFEIGDTESLPEDDPIGKQVRQMHRVDQRDAAPHAMPRIQLADAGEVDPARVARQEARLKELATLLPKGDPERGAKLFHSAKALCLTCHIK